MSIENPNFTQPIPFELQSLVDSHENPFVVIDRDYRIVAVNKAYEKLYGAGRENAVGLHCFKVSHDNDAPCCQSGEDCPHESCSKAASRVPACISIMTNNTACTRCG